MNIEALKERIDELKKALYAMIAKIMAIASDENEEIESVKQKAVEILNDVVARVDGQDLLRVDPDSFEKELDKVGQKAVELYESVQARIEAIRDASSKKEENEPESFLEEAANATTDELSAKAAAILSSWLKKEEIS